jgi:serine/threonine protein kinase
LADVHASGHLHRDVKPSNVLVRSSSAGRPIPGLAADEAVVLGDFGLARGLDLSAVTMVAGSPGYVAPEQAAGLTQLDRRADLYPLGRMMIEMLAGDPGGRATTMAGAATEQIDVVAALATSDGGPGAPSRDLVDLITRLVAKDPAERPESAEQVVAALAEIAGASAPTGGPEEGLPPTAAAAASIEPEGGPPRRRVAVIAAALIGVLAVVAVVVALVRDGEGGGSTGTTIAPTSPAPIVVPDVSSSVSSRVTSPVTSPAQDNGSSSSVAADELLVLPEGAFSSDAIGTIIPNTDRQEGVMLMGADEFAAALLAANPDWTGEPPAAAADGTLDFTMTGFERTADVHIEPAGGTSGAVIVAFTIDYV